MNILINKNVVLVLGINNGAIYNFNNNRIYSINHEALSFLLRFSQGVQPKTFEEQEYLARLEGEKLIQRNFHFQEYVPSVQVKNVLYFAWLEVTQLCNLRCVHCYEGDAHKSIENKLSVGEWKRIIKELSEVACPNIQFIGGEPSCYPNIVELIDFAGSLGFRSIGFFTNATRISDGLLSCLNRNQVRVNVSIYGHTAAVHDKITTIHGSFDKSINAIKKMINQGINVSVAITVMRENEQFFEEIVQLVKSLGVKHQKFDLVREVNGCRQNCHLVTREDLIQKKYRKKPNFSITKEWFDNSFEINTCWYGKFAIAENGDIFPCVFERNIKYGNLRNCSIQELLYSRKLTDCWHMDFSKIEECKDCEYRYACKDCRPLGMLNGGINKKSIRCSYSPKTGEWK